jgi:glycosyltransferase involved in cell wall biosynthesis
VAIAHDYLTQRGGAEKVVLAMCRAFPDAPIHTLLYDRDATYPEFADRDIRVSPINRIAPLRRHHRAALPVLPIASRSMFVDADVVLTSTSGWAHGFRTSGAKLVYCYSPARWLYLPDKYLGESSGAVKRGALRALSGYLRSWDRTAALSCDRYLAISTVVQQRIDEAYGLPSTVVPAPVTMSHSDVAEPVVEIEEWLSRSTVDRDSGYFLCVSRLLPYKNVEQIVRAFADSKRRLVLVGKGPEAERIRRIKTDNVHMVTNLTDGQMAWLYQNCTATIAASYEDFGLTPIEAGVWGKPSVVLRWGGFLDTVVEGVTGIFFDEPEPRRIAAALDVAERTTFDPAKIMLEMQRFTETRFSEVLQEAVSSMTIKESR